MFNQNKIMARANDMAPDMAINRIVEGTHVEGDIRCESNIRIDGRFKGNLTTKGRLVVGTSGVIEGTIECQNAEIEGSIKGRVSVRELLSLKSTAKLDGEIYTDKLAIEPGASFSGSCSMGAKVKEFKSQVEQPKAKEEPKRESVTA
jgi:cytoskeletal protein CcmA (bactofilin family)